jgi:hypothetical protein
MLRVLKAAPGDLEAWQGCIPTALTGCLAAQLHRARYVLAGLQGALGHYGTRTQRRWRWGCFMGKQRCIADVVRSLTSLDGRRLAREEVVIGFGAASGGGGGAISFKPGRVPIKALLWELCLYALVYMVDEFFTSQRCSHCCLCGQNDKLKKRGGTRGDDK